MLKIFSKCLLPYLSSLSGTLIIIATLASPGFSLVALLEGGRVEGNIVDPSGAGIAEARIVLRDRTGQVAYQTRANDEGRFVLSNVAEGDYALITEAAGFSQTERIKLSVGATRIQSVTVRLDVTAISDKIVVSATRTATLTDEVGGAATIIGSEDLKLSNQTQISESLRLVPGLVVAQSGGRGGITSIFARGGESDYNKVLIDGVPVNSAGGLFDFAPLATENVERVEVVRGPRSALFGSDAMTSVIQLFTARGSTSEPELELSGEGGSFAFNRETARLSGRAGRFDYSASFGFQATDGRFQNSDYTNRSASTNLGFRLSNDAELRLTTRLNNNSLGVAGPTSVLFADPDQRQKHHDLATSATLDLKPTSRWHNTARFIYSEFESFSFDPLAQDLTLPDRPPSTGFFGPDFAFTFHDHQKRAGVHYQTIAALSRSNVITGGMDFEHESAVFTDDFSRVTPGRNNLGFYLQDQAAWRNRLFVTAGIRVERNTGTVPEDFRAALASLDSSAPVGEVGFGITANPNLALSLLVRSPSQENLLGATRFKASYGTGIKEPRLDEAFSPSLFFLGNPGLDPERTTSFDAGASQEFFGRRASVELTYFDNRFRDVIDFVFDPVTFGPVRLADGRLTNFINIERASARGIELIAAARPLLRLHAAGSYTYLRSRLERAADSQSPEQGLPLTRRPRHSGTLEIGWIGQCYDITLDASIIGRRRDVDPVTGARFDLARRPIFNEGYARLNASGSYQVTRSVSVFARVENLLNEDYQEILGFPAYRLNFSAGLRVRIGGKN